MRARQLDQRTLSLLDGYSWNTLDHKQRCGGGSAAQSHCEWNDMFRCRMAVEGFSLPTDCIFALHQELVVITIPPATLPHGTLDWLQELRQVQRSSMHGRNPFSLF